jgi:hypothetical protein
MQHLEVSSAVRHIYIYMTLGSKGATLHTKYCVIASERDKSGSLYTVLWDVSLSYWVTELPASLTQKTNTLRSPKCLHPLQASNFKITGEKRVVKCNRKDRK